MAQFRKWPNKAARVTSTLLFTLSVIAASFSSTSVTVFAQAVSATPIRAILSTPTPMATIAPENSPTPTWTPTSEGPAQLEAKEDAGEVNVRAEPDPNAARLGSISTGERFVVRGRYFSWLQFDYPDSPTGTAWVFDGLVTIVGNANLIPEVDPYAAPTASDTQPNQTTTAEAILLTPGGDATLAADTRILVISPQAIAEATDPFDFSSEDSLATFTPASEIMPRSDVQQVDTEREIDEAGVPPIVPIAGLLVAGLLGLLISFVRR